MVSTLSLEHAAIIGRVLESLGTPMSESTTAHPLSAAHRFFAQVRMQVICLVIAMWCMRNVLKQKIVSASLFDQRRMKLTSAKGSGGAVANIAHKTALVKRKTSMDGLETVEFLPATTGRAPLSLEADPDLPTV